MCARQIGNQRLYTEPPNKEHFGDNISSAALLFVERLSSLGDSRCIVGIMLRPQVVSFVERFITLCPYLGESTIRGSTLLCTVHTYVVWRFSYNTYTYV